MTERLLILIEFKNYRITGPLIDQIVGTSMRVEGDTPSARISCIMIFCRGYTPDAEQRRNHWKKVKQVDVIFKVVDHPGATDA